MSGAVKEVDARETSSMRIWLGDDGIVRQEPFPGAHVSGEEARALVEHARALLGAARRRPLLVLASGTASIDREARRVFTGAAAAEVHSAVAIVVDSPLVSAMANFFVGLNRPVFPVKIFKDQPAALRWLRDHLEDETG